MPHPVLSKRLDNKEQYTPHMLISGVSFGIEGLLHHVCVP